MQNNTIQICLYTFEVPIKEFLRNSSKLQTIANYNIQ